MATDRLTVDVAIIGAGPAGLFAVFECGMLGLSCAVFDSLPEIGGQCTALYPEKPIYDIPAAPEILAGELIANLERQAAPFRPSYHLGQQIVALSKENGSWLLKTAAGLEASASAVIIAAGAGAFGPNRPPLENIEKYEGNGVQYMVRRKEDLRGKRIVIAGGGDSAVDWAVALAPIAASIAIVHRRDKFRAAPETVRVMETLCEGGKIQKIVPYQLHDIRGRDDGSLSSVIVRTLDGGSMELEADILLPFFGLMAGLGPIASWGLNLDHNHITVDPATCETSQAGIYAIGDIAAYKNKLKLILTGFNEGALAAHAIRRQLFPDQQFHFEYSTTKGLPSV
ncbi:MAG: NAD(P)/FAD-dependent oxidoreductase [Micavibrio sp.]